MATPALQVQSVNLQLIVSSESTQRVEFIAKDLNGDAIDVHTGWTCVAAYARPAAAPSWVNPTSIAGICTFAFAADGTVTIDIDAGGFALPSQSGQVAFSLSNDAGTTNSLAATGNYFATPAL